MTAAIAPDRRAVASTRMQRFVESGGIVWLVVAVLFVGAATASEDFRTLANLSNVSRQLVALGFVALAQFLVVVSGGIDLSVGAAAKLASITAAIVMAGADIRLPAAVAAVLLIGALVGAANGFAVTRLDVPPFVTTLGTLAVIQGLALFVAPTPRGRSAPLLSTLYSASFGPIYAMVLLLAVVWAGVWWALHRTAWGRHVYAVGGNAQVARLAGIRVGRVRFSVFVWSGILAALAGFVIVARSGVGDPNAGLGLEFEALAAVVIGGTSLFGGRGRLVGLLGGVVLLGMIGNIFNLVGIEVWYQQLIKGAVILVAGGLYVSRRGSQ